MFIYCYLTLLVWQTEIVHQQVIGGSGNHATLDELLLPEARYQHLLGTLQRENVNYELEILPYSAAQERVPHLIPQAYGIERQFVPHLAFMDGTSKNAISSNSLELVNDFEAADAITYFAILHYNSPAAHNAVRDMFGSNTNNIRLVVGYALAHRIPPASNTQIRGYVSSVITHNAHRQSGIGSEMMRCLFNELDELGDTILTTWVNNGQGRRPILPYYSPAPFWHVHGYNFMSESEVRAAIPILRAVHQAHGITNRQYVVGIRALQDIEYDLDPLRGEPRRIFTNMPKTSSVAIFPKYYANGWDGAMLYRRAKSAR